MSSTQVVRPRKEAPSTAEEVEFPVVSGSPPVGEDVPVPLAEPPTTLTMPAPVVTTTPPTAPTMRPTAPRVPPPASTMSPTAPTMIPTAPTIHPTVPTKPPAESPDGPTMPATAPTETDKQPMLCTMSDRITSSLQFPQDGLCDYIFFDSLYKGGRNLLTDPATYSSSLNTFLNDHRAYQRTTLGVGFAFIYLATAKEDLKVRNPSPLAPFWKEGIFHVGILDTPAWAVRIETRAAIATLKTINRLLDTQRHRGNFSITALAAPYPGPDWSVAYAKDFKDLRFTPYLFIMFGHYRFGDNTVRHCAVMPPTLHPDDALPDDIGRDYKYDLVGTHFTLCLHSAQLSRKQGRGLIRKT
ncbi:hypothetical protein HPB49_010879 [Dermacentor silvarum]|uniref:Uncharacterized protein n=1 Tax=Dermacentor silvarum TaxID=543639 RepID=A0ACB8CWQ8_DERSI|nr:hypothetical protein HPB49_010879 [Dermacentor silvarum]